MWVGGQHHAPAALPLRKTRYPLYRRLGGHHHTIQINHQPDATISPVFYLTFTYSSTCFGSPHAHHQELNKCSSSLWFYRWSVGGCSVVGRGRADHDQQQCYRYAPTVKPETATAVVELLMIGVRKPETCWAVHKRQVINLRNCCI